MKQVQFKTILRSLLLAWTTCWKVILLKLKFL